MSGERPDNDWFGKSPFVRSIDSPPPSAAIAVAFGAHSRHGSLTPVNDDNYLILRLGRYEEVLLTSLSDLEAPKRFDEWAYGMAVADGIGEAGEFASRLAISTLTNLAICFGRWNVRIDEPIAEEVMDRAGRFYRSIDATLMQASRDRPSQLQSALTGAFFAGSELFVAHVGHSRAYVFRDGELLQLTREIRLDRLLALKSRVTDRSAKVQELRPHLTETLGGRVPGVPTIDVVRCGLLNDDLILLCTNGLTDVAGDQRIADTLQSHLTPDDQSRALVDLAVELGSLDDVTALVAHYRVLA